MCLGLCEPLFVGFLCKKCVAFVRIRFPLIGSVEVFDGFRGLRGPQRVDREHQTSQHGDQKIGFHVLKIEKANNGGCL